MVMRLVNDADVSCVIVDGVIIKYELDKIFKNSKIKTDVANFNWMGIPADVVSPFRRIPSPHRMVCGSPLSFL